jgi:hypothetical protein
MSKTSSIKVTSHVGRDILASAAHFKTEASVAWEYVANSLQYVDSGVQPRVQLFVRQRQREIELRDNGRGMDADDLLHFFTMHAENLDRRAGQAGRGKFGTGKSAAFGIAKFLRVDTRRNGLRNVTELRRETIDASDGKSVPVDWLVRNEPTEFLNGTTVTIGEVELDRINTASIVEYIERHLSAFRYRHPEVAVNDYLCSYREISIAKTSVFRPASLQAQKIGDVELVVKVAQAPLSEEDQGVLITAGPGNLVARECAGLEKKEFGNYLFGEIDVPALETSDSPIQPYDSARTMQLNPRHPVAAALLGFIGSKLEEVRQELLRDAKEARKTEQARRLALEAKQIAEIINRDFNDVRQRLHEIRSASARPGTTEATFGDAIVGGTEPESWKAGEEEPGRLPKSGRGEHSRGGAGRDAPDVTTKGYRDDLGTDSVDPVGGPGSRTSRPKGGFDVAYRNLGKEEGRSKTDAVSLTILINLDHALVKAALGEGNVQDTAFKRLSYEIAFSEYAMALGYEVCRQDPNLPGDDVLYEVRTSLNRISTAAAPLYR